MATAPAPSKPLPDVYHDWLAMTVDEKGFEIPHGLVISRDGSITVVALAVPNQTAYRVMLQQLAKPETAEVIFALDRFTKPNQGTSLADVMAGWYFERGAEPRPFIVEYQFDPRVVLPIDWNNKFWNAGLTTELVQACGGIAMGRA